MNAFAKCPNCNGEWVSVERDVSNIYANSYECFPCNISCGIFFNYCARWVNLSGEKLLLHWYPDKTFSIYRKNGNFPLVEGKSLPYDISEQRLNKLLLLA